MSEKQTKEFRKKNGFVFQDSALWANRSMYQNLELPLKFHFPELSDEKTTVRVNELLERIGLLSQSHLRPANLSFGEQKIVSFARALVVKPSILFMDEPTQSIDIRILKVMNDMIHELKGRQCTMVIVTHDQELTSQIADNLVVIKGGKILEEGPFDTVKNSRNDDVQSVLSSVLSRPASYDTDILGLLDGGMT
jgi:ABC-type transporter Mla maintaining outer membrane lipid asymmetry ATPase subunit MlaF